MPNIIDSHVHFWDPAQLDYAWLQENAQLNRPYLPDHVPAAVDDKFVSGIVFVQADCAPDQGLREADWVSELAANDPRIRGIVAFAPVARGVAVRNTLQDLIQRPLVKSIRQLIQDEPMGFSTQPQFVEGVRLLAEYNLRFDLCIRYWQLNDVTQLVRQCPEVRFVLDHIGKPGIKSGEFKEWSENLARLADLPNVFCKLSGIVTEADHAAWTAEQIQPYIDHTLKVFGVQRVMFGSDAPVLYLAGTYEKWVRTLSAATADLDLDSQQALWHDNAAAFYNL